MGRSPVDRGHASAVKNIGQQPAQLLLDYCVALTCASFQSAPVQNGNVAAAIAYVA